MLEFLQKKISNDFGQVLWCSNQNYWRFTPTSLQQYTEQSRKQYLPISSKIRQRSLNQMTVSLLGQMATHKASSPNLQKVGFVQLHLEGTLHFINNLGSKDNLDPLNKESVLKLRYSTPFKQKNLQIFFAKILKGL